MIQCVLRNLGMEILRADLGTCSDLRGTVVVIDVLRSFSSAAYAFASGARAIYPVENETAAWQLLAHLPGALTMGALGGGVPIHGFDLTNMNCRRPTWTIAPLPTALILRCACGAKTVSACGAKTVSL